jgi:hypothetical protein
LLHKKRQVFLLIIGFFYTNPALKKIDSLINLVKTEHTIHLFEFVQFFMRLENGYKALDQRFFDTVIHEKFDKLDGYSQN